ncbi:DNA replication regulator SLD3-domain-containing protein [Xylogone sp. PMI_703]|nr:DNA replication regulator SLD3-domain-containing protein [Xylogone sp. PMI_703]
MLSQNGRPLFNASAKTRPTLPILSLAAMTSLSPSDGNIQGLKKRKRDGSTIEDLLKEDFDVKPYPSSFTKPRTLQPVMLLPRAQLPLSCLDISSASTSATALPQSRLFESNVKILELEERMGSQPMVLIARLDDRRTMYAVERESKGLYVLCRLGSWVDLSKLKASSVVSKPELCKITNTNSTKSNGQPGTAILTPEMASYSKEKRRAIEAIQSIVKRPSSAVSPESQPISVEKAETVAKESSGDLYKEPVEQTSNAASLTQQTATEIFDNASLAYFAKGPLSRSRAAFHLDCDSVLEMNDLIAFLESLVLSTNVIDKKYRDGVPGCVNLINIHVHSADELSQDGTRPKKSRASKKMKPGKSGLYPSEDVFIRKWWASYDDESDSGAPNSSREELTKKRISELRIRETQLQIILILEILALKGSSSNSDAANTGLPGEIPSDAKGKDEKSPKSKKPDQLGTLIDVHVDRLCIWQSLVLEGVKTTVKGLENQSSTEKLANSDASADALRDFCVDVIAPFFSARLPDLCAVLYRKLGGPVLISPPKRKVSKSSSFSSAQSRPGAATKRSIPVNPSKSLVEILSEERRSRQSSQGPSKAISLMRSATMPIVGGIKREESEGPSLSKIPLADTRSSQSNRMGLSRSRSISARDVNIGLPNSVTGVKTKRQVDVEAELKEAISTLKKPNRELVAKELAETAEKRSATTPQYKKIRKPIKQPIFKGVQITTTPKTNRQKDIFSESQNQRIPDLAEERTPSCIPTSSAPRVPESTIRSSYGGRLVTDSTFPSIQATPTRKSQSASHSGDLLGVGPVDYNLVSSPMQAHHLGTVHFPSIPNSAAKSGTGASNLYGIQETPIKKKSVVIAASPHSMESAKGSIHHNVENSFNNRDAAIPEITTKDDESLYKALGWDDDDIDELT